MYDIDKKLHQNNLQAVSGKCLKIKTAAIALGS